MSSQQPTTSEPPRFDPADFFRFDLEGGAVRTRGGARVVVLAAEAVGPLVAAAVARGDLTAMRRFGRQVGGQVADSLGASPAEAPADVVLGHLRPLFALFGWGALRAERWGDALVMKVDDPPQLDEERLALAALLGGALSAASGRDVACVPLPEEGFLVVAPDVAEQVWRWAHEGVGLLDILGRLAPAPAAEEE